MISALLVKELREKSGAGMMDAKKALIEAEGDAEAAAQILREKGLAKAATRTDRENAEGSVAVVAEGNKAALVHVKCETDFSAKSEQFQTFVDSLTANVFSNGVDAVDGYTQELDDLRLSIKENVEVGKVEVVEAEEGNLIDVYLHKQDNSKIIQGEFSLKNLGYFIKCTNLCSQIEMYLENDLPLIVKYSVASLGDIKLCLAPLPP